MIATIVREDAVAGEVNCLGWCGKKFHSLDRANLRYCKVCAAQKERAERGLSNIRKCGSVHGFSLPPD